MPDQSTLEHIAVFGHGVKPIPDNVQIPPETLAKIKEQLKTADMKLQPAKALKFDLIAKGVQYFLPMAEWKEKINAST